MIYYTRKDSFDRAVGNNSVCKSCAQMDRKLTMDTIEKMKQPKSIEHKNNIYHVSFESELYCVSVLEFPENATYKDYNFQKNILAYTIEDNLYIANNNIR